MTDDVFAARRTPVLIDGFITAAAALAAVRLCPDCVEALIAAHRSPEPGHEAILTALSLDPLLDLGLRLGEGTGAALAMPLVASALALLQTCPASRRQASPMRAPDETTIPAVDIVCPSRRIVAAALGAVAFLTRAPVGRWADADLASAAPLFPAVGALIGAAVGGAATLLTMVLPPLVAAGIAVASEAAITGALHLDALADSADGLAGRDRDHALEIMRDHGVGAYGACVLILDLLIKAASLGTLATGGGILPVTAAYAISRAAPLPLAALLGPARPQPGVGRMLAGAPGARRRARRRRPGHPRQPPTTPPATSTRRPPSPRSPAPDGCSS